MLRFKLETALKQLGYNPDKTPMWKPIDPAAKKLVDYAGPLPTRLYRYRSLSPSTISRVISFEILDESIFLAGLKDLNDPDEGRFTISFGSSHAAVLDYFRKTVRESDLAATDDQVEVLVKSYADEIARNGYQPTDNLVSCPSNS